MARSSIADLVYTTLDAEAERYLDVQIDLVRQTTGELMLRVGGRWDRQTKRYVGDAAESVVISVYESQVEAVRLLRDWLAGFITRKRRRRRGEKITAADLVGSFYTLVCMGGRRSGKTVFAASMLIPVVLVAVPGTIAWAVTPELEEGNEDEIRRWFNVAFARDWIRWNERRGSAVLVNGSQIVMKTALVARRLKKGRADVILLNEPQEMHREAYNKTRPAVADEGGLVVMAANPANGRPEGYWIDELVAKGRHGVAEGVRVLDFDRTLNQGVDHRALELMRQEMSPRDFAIEIEGKSLPRTDVVFHGWSPNPWPAGNLRARPLAERDVTAQFLQRKLGRPFRYIIGADFQRTPHMVATMSKIFDDGPCACGDPHGWYVGGVVVPNASEDELCERVDEWFARNDPELVKLDGWRNFVAWVPDGTGDYQGADRVKGKTSWDRLRANGWRFLYYPDAKIERNNPHVTERVKATNARFCTRPLLDGKETELRHWFLDPPGDGCAEIAEALMKWETKRGVFPNKDSEYAHVGDGASYPIVRLYPRRARPTKVEYRSLERMPTARARALEGY